MANIPNDEQKKNMAETAASPEEHLAEKLRRAACYIANTCKNAEDIKKLRVNDWFQYSALTEEERNLFMEACKGKACRKKNDVIRVFAAVLAFLPSMCEKVENGVTLYNKMVASVNNDIAVFHAQLSEIAAQTPNYSGQVEDLYRSPAAIKKIKDHIDAVSAGLEGIDLYYDEEKQKCVFLSFSEFMEKNKRLVSCNGWDLGDIKVSDFYEYQFFCAVRLILRKVGCQHAQVDAACDAAEKSGIAYSPSASKDYPGADWDILQVVWTAENIKRMENDAQLVLQDFVDHPEKNLYGSWLMKYASLNPLLSPDEDKAEEQYRDTRDASGSWILNLCALYALGLKMKSFEDLSAACTAQIGDGGKGLEKHEPWVVAAKAGHRASTAREDAFLTLLIQAMTRSELNTEGMEALRKRKQGCYIATCVYGSYDCPEVWTLRRYRDDKLAATCLGKLFIRIYYTLSPTLVKCFGTSAWFCEMWRGILDKKVEKLNRSGFAPSPYRDRN